MRRELIWQIWGNGKKIEGVSTDLENELMSDGGKDEGKG